MDNVHVFICTGRFHTHEEMRAFIDETYTEDGDGVPSAFMREVGLFNYEPACIEAILSKSGSPVQLAELLAAASYADQWLKLLPQSLSADAAICVYSPNCMRNAKSCSVKYVGQFSYHVEHPAKQLGTDHVF